jgi:hypothetical protein
MKTLALAAALMAGGTTQAQDIKKASGDIVISKVFYAGTTLKGSNRTYNGGEEYIELHNNGNTEVDLAGLYIGLVESEGNTGAYLAGDITEPANGVALKQLFQIPTDKVYAIAPRGTVVIATAAIDHSGEAENGPDLSRADFEFGGHANDNPDVPNLVLKFTFNDKIQGANITNGGDAGIMIFSEKNGDSKLGYDNPDNLVYANGKTIGNQYLKVNGYYAMDAVEILKNKNVNGVWTADSTRKRFNDGRDKGYILTSESMIKDGFVAYRRTALNTDGEFYLYDTNNSSVDFTVSNTIAPKAYDEEEYGTTEATVVIPESGYLPFKAPKYFFTGKDLYIAYVNISAGSIKFNSFPGNSVVASNSVYVLVGAPGEHVIHYTEADRTLHTAGSNNWIEDGDDHYLNGVYTATKTNRYPMKFVNEKGNVRFVRDMQDNNPKTMNIDVESEGRFFIEVTSYDESENEIRWAGITPEEVIALGVGAVTITDKQSDKAVYNLQGVKMNTNNLPKGIYIRGGKKFVVK